MEAGTSKLLDFSGQNIYVGMDVHQKSWKIHLYSDEFELKAFSQQPGVNQLSSYLHSHYPGASYLLAYEAGFSGFWIQRAFAAKGINCKVVHAADVPTNNREQLRKTDKVDSKKIAKGLKNGELNFIHVPDIELELDRQLIRSRSQIVQDATRIKNRIKSLLKLHGIVIPVIYKEGNWSKGFVSWLLEIDFKNTSGRLAMQTQVDEFRFLEEKKKSLEAAVKDLSLTSRYSTNARLLQTIPSIGLLTSMVLLTEIGDINRFKRIDELCSYCGIVPNCHSSGESENIGSLSRRGNSAIKKMLIECAWIAVKKDPALLQYYKLQLVRMTGQKAIIKVARKLLSRIRYVLMTQNEYVLGVIE